MQDESDFTYETLIAWRDSLGTRFKDPARINKNFIRKSVVQVGEFEALKTGGLWETFGTLGGGPFVSYLIYDDNTLYLLDGQVFAPDRPKLLFLRQLEIMMQTFVPPTSK